MGKRRTKMIVDDNKPTKTLRHRETYIHRGVISGKTQINRGHRWKKTGTESHIVTNTNTGGRRERGVKYGNFLAKTRYLISKKLIGNSLHPN